MSTAAGLFARCYVWLESESRCAERMEVMIMDDCGAPWNLDQDEETGQKLCSCPKCRAYQRNYAAMQREIEESGMFDDFFWRRR